MTALLSGFMGASLPKGQSAGCLGGISREAKLPHPHRLASPGCLGVGRKAKLSHLPHEASLPC